MYKPKVSIIVPVYNVAEYLPECLDSLINQTLSEIEIICIDDKSTDNSAEILKEYAQKDSRIKVIFNEKNLGTGSSRNKALDITMGEYIGFVDSDDWVSLDFFEILYKRAKEENTEISATSRFIYYYNENKQLSPTTKLEGKKSIKSIKDKGNSLIKTMIFCNGIYSDNFLKKYNVNFQENSYAEDLKFCIPCYFFSNKIAISDKPVYFYRHERIGSAVTGIKDIKFISALFSSIESCYKILQDSDMNLFKKNNWKCILGKRFLNHLMFAYDRTKYSQRKEFIELINKKLGKSNIQKIIQRQLFEQKMEILVLILLEILTLKLVKKIIFLRKSEMENAVGLKKRIKEFELIIKGV